MPLRNPLFGVFKVIEINGVQTLAVSASQNRTMKTEQQNYIQGTAEARILDIGALSEEIQIEAPILIGPASGIDGRTLLNTQIAKAAKVDSTELPILSNAKISIDAEQGGTVSVTLKSDGQKLTGDKVPFRIYDGSPSALLDPLGAEGPSRVAKNYDFQVVFGPYVAYVQKAEITVAVDTQESVFLSPGAGAVGVSADDLALMGTQYPFLGVSSIKVSGEGTAAVITGTYNPGDNTFSGGVNDPQVIGSEDMTIQEGGLVVSTTNDFKFNVYDGVGGVTNLFEYNGNALVDLSKAVINSTNFSVSTGILTVNFGFNAWVKIDTSILGN